MIDPVDRCYRVVKTLTSGEIVASGKGITNRWHFMIHHLHVSIQSI